MQISAANLLIASQQGRPAPKPEPSQSFSAALASDGAAQSATNTDRPSEEFAPLSFKMVSPPPAPVTQKAASPYGAPAALGSQIDIVI